jgi:hypothetical protein
MEAGQQFTAVASVSRKVLTASDYQEVTFVPDYGRGRNADWASATPSMTLTMNVRRELAERLDIADEFDIVFTRRAKPGDRPDIADE